FDVQRDHVPLLDLAMARLAPDGALYFSNNIRKFRLDEALAARYRVEEISDQTLDADFLRNPRTHRAWRLTRARMGMLSGARCSCCRAVARRATAAPDPAPPPRPTGADD